MPYIVEALREQVQANIDSIDWHLAQHKNFAARQWTLVAVLVATVTRAMEPETGWRYYNLHCAYGVFAAAAAEAARRLGTGNPYTYTEAWGPSIRDYQNDIDQIVDWVQAEDSDKRVGYLNYIVSRLTSQALGLQYHTHLTDTLRLAGSIFYSTVVGPYEDVAIKKNGDMPAYRGVT